MDGDQFRRSSTSPAFSSDDYRFAMTGKRDNASVPASTPIKLPGWRSRLLSQDINNKSTADPGAQDFPPPRSLKAALTNAQKRQLVLQNDQKAQHERSHVREQLQATKLPLTGKFSISEPQNMPNSSYVPEGNTAALTAHDVQMQKREDNMAALERGIQEMGLDWRETIAEKEKNKNAELVQHTVENITSEVGINNNGMKEMEMMNAGAFENKFKITKMKVESLIRENKMLKESSKQWQINQMELMHLKMHNDLLAEKARRTEIEALDSKIEFIARIYDNAISQYIITIESIRKLITLASAVNSPFTPQMIENIRTWEYMCEVLRTEKQRSLDDLQAYKTKISISKQPISLQSTFLYPKLPNPPEYVANTILVALLTQQLQHRQSNVFSFLGVIPQSPGMFNPVGVPHPTLAFPTLRPTHLVAAAGTAGNWLQSTLPPATNHSSNSCVPGKANGLAGVPNQLQQNVASAESSNTSRAYPNFFSPPCEVQLPATSANTACRNVPDLQSAHANKQLEMKVNPLLQPLLQVEALEQSVADDDSKMKVKEKATEGNVTLSEPSTEEQEFTVDASQTTSTGAVYSEGQHEDESGVVNHPIGRRQKSRSSSKNCKKVAVQIQNRFPFETLDAIYKLVLEVRANNGGKLTGLTYMEIIEKVAQLRMKAQEKAINKNIPKRGNVTNVL